MLPYRVLINFMIKKMMIGFIVLFLELTPTVERLILIHAEVSEGTSGHVLALCDHKW